MSKRQYYKGKGNNPNNQNKNICTSAVCDYFGVTDQVHYLHTTHDVVRAIRKEFTVRSRSSQFRNMSVARARSKMKEMAEDFESTSHVWGFLVFVNSHVLFVNRFGDTIVDTDSRKADRRKIVKIYIVY